MEKTFMSKEYGWIDPEQWIGGDDEIIRPPGIGGSDE
jgi:hypothetical protein